MSKEQIEEMAKDLKLACISHYKQKKCNTYESCRDCQAAFLYNAGYRKQSEVAIEILDELLEKLELISIVAQPTDGFTQGVIKTFNKTSALISELKKKYTEEKR